MWIEVVRGVYYLHNHRTTRSLPDSIPERAFTRKKQDISNLCIFRTKVFIYLSKHHRDKLGAKSKKCYLLSLDLTNKGYRCYCPSTKKIIRDVKIDEFDFLQSHRPSHQSPTSFYHQ